jgi:uncharacterized membrane protein
MGHRGQYTLAHDRPLAQDTRGVATVMLAISLMMLLGIATVSIDLASIYLAKRKLQGIADAAAMAAAQAENANDRKTAANLVIGQSKASNVEIDGLLAGTYTQDRSIAYGERFQPGGEQSAVQLTLVQTVPLFFGRALGFDDAKVSASATAARIDMAAYSLGTKLATLSGGIPNKLLSALIGTNLELSALDGQALASTNVDVLGFADALKAQVGGKEMTYGQLFDQSVSLVDALDAVSRTTTDSGAAALLQHIADSAEARDIRLADIIDLGPYGQTDYNTGNLALQVDAYSLVRSMLEISLGEQYDINYDLDVPSLTSTNVRIVGGRGMASSPWLTVTSSKDYVLRTSQTRIYLTSKASTGSPLLPSLSLPIYLELAEAEARLDDISCTGDPDTDGVTLAVTPSIGQLGIGSFDSTTDMADFSTPVSLQPATLLSVPLIAKVTGKAQIDFGGMTAKNVLFSMQDIDDKVIKTVSTDDLLQSVASSLVKHTDLTVKTLGLTVNGSAVTSLVGNTLSTVAPFLDSTIFSLTDAAGLKVGAADVRVDKVRCGLPLVVA